MRAILKQCLRMPKLCLALALLALSGASARALDGAIGIHDPSTVILCNGNYYVFGTGRGISALTSSNGFDWQRGGRVFDHVPETAARQQGYCPNLCSPPGQG